MMIFLRIFVLLFIYSNVFAIDRGTLQVFKLNVDKVHNIIAHLQTASFTLVYNITPSTHILQYNGGKSLTQILITDENFSKQILETEPVKILRGKIQLEGDAENLYEESFTLPDVKNSSYYGMGVEDVWAMGYTGKGVVLGVVGVGIDTHLLDLKENINKDWSFNFVQNKTNVAPEHFQDNPKTLRDTNHGNNVASIIAAVKDNNFCSAGIAYHSQIVVLKVFEFNYTDNSKLSLNHWTASDALSRALVYKLHDIEILVLAWTFKRTFHKLDLPTREALVEGVKEGRNDRGRIYVVAAGPIGNELTNNINTITVNGMSKNGYIPKKTHLDTSVLTSGLADGNSLTSSYMFTTTSYEECSIGFSGVSAATSQIAAIIALALQTNPHLSTRSIQHLIVRSSQANGLEESHNFNPNGAGRGYHPYFGFGLLNASKMIELALEQDNPSYLLSKKFELAERSFKSTFKEKFHYYCNRKKDFTCIEVVEHVAVTFDFMTDAKHLSLSVTSPSETISLFLENFEVDNGTVSGKLVSANFWDESAFGEWFFKITMRDPLSGNLKTDIKTFSLELYGTNRTGRYTDDRNDNDLKNKNYENEKESQQNPDYMFMIYNFAVIALVIIVGYIFR